ncbi:MAG: putative endopeptidase, partial [Kiritimatiellia bacterium]
MRQSLSMLAFAMLAACNGPNQTEGPKPGADVDVDKAPDYLELEASVKATMNTEADPCVDFYEYSCGGWLEATELPSDKTSYTRGFSLIYDANQAMLKDVLDNVAPDATGSKAKVGDFYQACMDEEAIEAQGLAPIKPYLDAVDQAETAQALFVLGGRMQLTGGDPLLSLGVEPDYKNPDLNVLQLGQGGITLPDRSFYLNEDSAEIKVAYQAHVAKMFQIAGDSEEVAKARAQHVVDIETKLAEASVPKRELRDATKTYHPMDRKALAELAPGLNWDGYFEQMTYPGVRQLNVTTPEFFPKIEQLLAETDVGAMRSYFRFRVLSVNAPYLNKAMDEQNFAFMGTELNGQKQQRARWKRCVARTEAVLGEELGQVYVQTAFPGESKTIALDMIKNIEASFEANLPQLEWMDDATRLAAVGKVKAITNKIGYPDKWRDYSKLNVEAGRHFGNVINGREHEARYYLNMMDKPVDKSLWYMSPQTVNAYYNPLANEIVFPAGILQPPFFKHDYPAGMNYGAMGMIMGHEVSHGFDDSGRMFNAKGEMAEWWAPEVAERFDERTQCLNEQYAAYEVQPGLHMDGKLTLGENIADLAGMKQSYGAYMEWRKVNGEEPKIAGLTNEQLYFVAAAQGWCTLATPEAEKVRVRSDPHAIARYRVNGPVRNLPEFGKAFACEQGAPLYPKT